MSDSQKMIHVRILFFATIKERVGKKEIELQLPEGTNIGNLKKLLAEMFPSIEISLNTVIVALNREFALDEYLIPDQAEIAFFPPVSGGSAPQDGLPTLVSVTEETISLDDLVAQITLPSTGAACIFSGFVRGITKRGEERQTEFLQYEAYHSMAEEKMRQVVKEIRERWPEVIGIAVVQRIGKLYPQTPTVLVACTAAHRDTGVFEAARYGIDRLKEIVPIWKKEVGSMGEIWVEGEYFPKPGE